MTDRDTHGAKWQSGIVTPAGLVVELFKASIKCIFHILSLSKVLLAPLYKKQRESCTIVYFHRVESSCETILNDFHEVREKDLKGNEIAELKRKITSGLLHLTKSIY